MSVENKKIETSKADPDVHRLEDMETMFVSLVDRGANRQKKFFVVKAEDGTPDAGVIVVCVDCGHEAKQEESTVCPECGGEMKPKVETAPAQDEDGADSQEKIEDDNTDQDTPPNDGGETEEESKADLGSWLEEAGERANELLVDLTLEQGLAAAPSEDSVKSHEEDDNSDDVSVVGEEGSTPLEDHVPGPDEVSSQELQKARDENTQLKKELSERERALKVERSRVKTLKSSIGAATALPTGETSIESVMDRPEGWAGDLATDADAD